MAAAVVLLHGLWMRGPVMSPLALRLQAAGFAVHLFSYPTRQRPSAANARSLAEFVAALGEPVVHCVGHSLGGLVLRHYAASDEPARPGRFVTLGTPHRGSFAAGRVARLAPGGEWLLGASLDRALLGDAPPWDGRRELGSIAGTLPVGLGRIFPRLPRPNDGVVTVAETRLEGAADHITLPVNHLGLLLAPRVARQVAHFLAHGRFRHD
jgi:pimeloyl-ACP methyl ester carboxylesterase